MTQNLRKCKRCLLYETADTAAYESVKNYLEAMPANLKVSDSEYSRRLSLCRECDRLLSGMCLRCGCYVEIRAAGTESHCPGNIW